MTAEVETRKMIDREAAAYWNSIKDANSHVKLTLISLLSSSLIAEEKPLKRKAHRVETINYTALDELTTSTPIDIEADTDLDDIVAANSGKLLDGMERWL